MAFMTTRIKIEDYDAWKAMFDSDPHDIRACATSHRIFRLVDEPNELLLLVEFETADDASAAHEKLIASGVLERVTVVTRPALAVQADALTY